MFVDHQLKKSSSSPPSSGRTSDVDQDLLAALYLDDSAPFAVQQTSSALSDALENTHLTSKPSSPTAAYSATVAVTAAAAAVTAAIGGVPNSKVLYQQPGVMPRPRSVFKKQKSYEAEVFDSISHHNISATTSNDDSR
eukprot:gene3828-4898_t